MIDPSYDVPQIDWGTATGENSLYPGHCTAPQSRNSMLSYPWKLGIPTASKDTGTSYLTTTLQSESQTTLSSDSQLILATGGVEGTYHHKAKTLPMLRALCFPWHDTLTTVSPAMSTTGSSATLRGL